MKNLKEQLMHLVFLLSACVSILCVAMICVFLFANGIPAIGKIGVFQFLAGEKWKPGNDLYGILPMMVEKAKQHMDTADSARRWRDPSDRRSRIRLLDCTDESHSDRDPGDRGALRDRPGSCPGTSG